jgi:hypothetical protein
MTDYVASHYIAFPVQVAEHEGVTLTVEISDGRQPHQAPPGHLEVWLRRPAATDGKPGAVAVDGSLCRFFATFDENEEITKTQAERNELREQLKLARDSERELRKQVGQLDARVKELEAEVAKQRKDVLREITEAQIITLKTRLDRT